MLPKELCGVGELTAAPEKAIFEGGRDDRTLSRMVSCLCPTYNRAPYHLHLLRDAVRCFLDQRLPAGVAAELVILNDTPGQFLTTSAPNVRVHNHSSRYATLGDKRSALVTLARGDILMVWDDDDLSLRGRIEQALDYIGRGWRYFNPGWSLYEERGKERVRGGGVCHNASAYTREAFLAVGGLYASLCGGEDADMDRRLREKFGCNAPVKESEYVYRWGVAPHHISGLADYSAADTCAEHYRRIGEMPVVRGVFDITPLSRLVALAC